MKATNKRLKVAVQDLYCTRQQTHAQHTYVRKTARYLVFLAKHFRDVCERLSLAELCLAAAIGLVFGGLLSQNFERNLVTILCLVISTSISFSIRSNWTYPVKTFFLDFPVHGVGPLWDDKFLVTGGGGGMVYGVADESMVLACIDASRVPVTGIAINLFVQYNDQFDEALALSLRYTELQVNELLASTTLWGISTCPHKGLIAGGHDGSLKLFKSANDKPSLQLQFLSEHVMVKQSVTQKKKVLLSRTVFSDSGALLAAATESNNVCIYSVPTDIATERDSLVYKLLRTESNAPEKLLLLGEYNADPSQDGCIISIRFDAKEKRLIALTTKGVLLWLRVPNSVEIGIMRGKVTVSASPGGVIFLPQKNVLELLSKGSIPHEEIFIAKELLASPLAPPERGREAEQDLLVAGVFRKSRWGDRPAVAVVQGYWVEDGSGVVRVRPESVRMRRVSGLECVTCACYSSDWSEVALASNSQFATLDSRSLKLTRLIERFDAKSTMTTLPTTCITFLQNDRYIVVGGADYSLTVCQLHGEPLRKSSKLRSTWKALTVPLQMRYTGSKVVDLMMVAAGFWFLPSMLIGFPIQNWLRLEQGCA